MASVVLCGLGFAGLLTTALVVACLYLAPFTCVGSATILYYFVVRRQYAPTAITLPLMTWPRRPFTRQLQPAGSVPVRLETLHEEPRIVMANGLLDNTQCMELIAMAEPRIELGLHSSGEVDGRTSKHTTLIEADEEQHPLSALLRRRLAELLGCDESFIEPLQVVRYRAGEEFCTHHDVLEPRAMAGLRHQRGTTAFVYLSEVPTQSSRLAGSGETFFPILNLKVQPRAGAALLWHNVLHSGQPDPAVTHAGLPVEAGVKYGVNAWVRNEPWCSVKATAITMLKRRHPWLFPKAEVAKSLCIFCGAPLPSEADRWLPGTHSYSCLFWKAFMQVDPESLKGRTETVFVTVEKCNIRFELPASMYRE